MRTYAITGAGSGIGRATREHLEAGGGRVIGVDLVDAEVVADVSLPAGRNAAVRGVLELCRGELNGVVACAGVSAVTGPRQALVIAVNYFGAVAVLEGLRHSLSPEGNSGAVAIASAATVHPARHSLVQLCLDGNEEMATEAGTGDGAGAYVASKVALARWVRRYAPLDEWAGRGIALNAVSPGLVATPMMDDRMRTSADRLEMAARYPMPLHGVAQPHQIAPVIAMLISGENSHVTGQNIFVDGGTEAIVRGDVVW